VLVASTTRLYGHEALLQQIITGIERPVALANAGDNSGRLFIAEQAGIVWTYKDNHLNQTPFLTIADRVSCCDELGLLGLAFHPKFASNGELYVNYTDNNGDTIIARYRSGENPNIIDPASEEIILKVNQPLSNHNGGHLAFGPDGFLYIGLGDGGGSGDPQNNAQMPLTLLGKMLRIDVDSNFPYAIPDSNPFAEDDFTLDEIWALGLRNPFRYSFDRITGDLFIADVGQDLIEEVNIHYANTPAGENFGWRRMEGSACFIPLVTCNFDNNLTLPEFQYIHSQGRCSITGGYVYRGSILQSLYGDYIYGDFCSGEIFRASSDDRKIWATSVFLETNLSITTFGEDEAGELYVADLGGAVYQLKKTLTISPGSGTYHSAQEIDLAVIVLDSDIDTANFNVLATLDGADVSQVFLDCAISQTLDNGGATFTCPDLPISLLPAGRHELHIAWDQGSGNVATDKVVWEILDVIQ